MAEQDDLYLENLDEYVNDENKIITYKGLSNLLKVTTNKSKEMLHNFVEQQSSKGNQLNTTFILGGRTANDDKAYKFLIVTKEKLEDTKSKFCQVTCCHIYSVQKARLKSFEVLHDTDHDMVKNSLFEFQNFSSIYCPEAKVDNAALRRRETKDEPQNLANGFHDNSQTTVDHSKKKEAPVKQSSSTGKPVTSASFFGTTNKKQTEKSKDQGTAKNEMDNLEKHADIGSTNKGKTEKKEVSFFGKPVKGKNQAASKGADVEMKKQKGTEKRHQMPVEDSVGETEDKHEDLDKMHEDVMKKKEGESGRKKSEKKGETGKDKGSKKSKRTEHLKTTEDEPNVKRRKTEIQDSASEEEDDFESFIKISKGENDNQPDKKKAKGISKGEKRKREKVLEFEESSACTKSTKSTKQSKEMQNSKKEAPIEPPRVQSKEEENEEKMEQEAHEGSEELAQSDHQASVEEKPKEKRRIRRKVLKSKTFMNDEGYMVTEKVYESESASEESDSERETKKTTRVNDAVHKRPKEITAENKKIKAEASKSKTQSSLMNFFKKK